MDTTNRERENKPRCGIGVLGRSHEKTASRSMIADAPLASLAQRRIASGLVSFAPSGRESGWEVARRVRLAEHRAIEYEYGARERSSRE